MYYDKNYNNPKFGNDKKIDPSFLKHEQKNPECAQNDSSNCGVHSILECIQQLCGGHKYYVSDSKKNEKNLQHF